MGNEIQKNCIHDSKLILYYPTLQEIMQYLFFYMYYVLFVSQLRTIHGENTLANTCYLHTQIREFMACKHERTFICTHLDRVHIVFLFLNRLELKNNSRKIIEYEKYENVRNEVIFILEYLHSLSVGNNLSQDFESFDTRQQIHLWLEISQERFSFEL